MKYLKKFSSTEGYELMQISLWHKKKKKKNIETLFHQWIPLPLILFPIWISHRTDFWISCLRWCQSLWRCRWRNRQCLHGGFTQWGRSQASKHSKDTLAKDSCHEQASGLCAIFMFSPFGVFKLFQMFCPEMYNWTYNFSPHILWSESVSPSVVANFMGTMDSSPPGSSIHREFSNKNIGWVCPLPPQGIFPIWGSNLHFLWILHHWATRKPLMVLVTCPIFSCLGKSYFQILKCSEF